MIKILCDRCGAEINPGKIGYVALNYREAPGGGFVTANQFEDSHFCPTCMEKITRFIINPDQPAKEASAKAEKAANEPSTMSEAPDPKPAKKKPAQKRIDYGKIMALKNAGWSNAKIADEMGMTNTAVTQAIYMYKKKHEAGEVRADATNRE